MPFYTSSSTTALCAIIAVTSYFLFSFQRPLFPNSSPFFQSFCFSISSSVFFTPLTYLYPRAFVIPWLLLLHEKGGSILSVLLRVKTPLDLHRVRCRRLRSAQLSLYGIPGTPPACFFLKYLTVKPLLPLILGCSLASPGLLVSLRFQIQGRF